MTSTSAPEVSTSTLIDHLSIVPVGRIPKFKLYPCQKSKIGKKDVVAKSAPLSPPSAKRLRNLAADVVSASDRKDVDVGESKNDGDACPNDGRLIMVQFRRLTEVDNAGATLGHSSVDLATLKYDIDTSVIDTIKYSATFDAAAFATKTKCTTVQTYTGSTILELTANILRGGSDTGLLVGTVGEDSLKWSYNITNWPYCTGTSGLDLIVLINSRGYVKDEEDRLEDSMDAADENHDPRTSVATKGRLPKKTVVGGLSKIVFPATATLDGSGNYLVRVNTDVFGRGSTALVNYNLPVSYVNDKNVTVYAQNIYYDPSVSMDPGSDPSAGLSPGAIGGIVASVFLLMIAVAGFFVYRKKATSHPVL